MKAPFKRGTKLTLTDVLVNGGMPTPVKYVKWMGFERSSLIVVELEDGTGRRFTAHVNTVTVRQ